MTGASTAATSSWTLVGRTSELERIERSRSSGDRAVLLNGAAGVGKSRLMHEALARFSQAGAQTRWVQATSSAATVPLGAFAGMLPDSTRSDDPLRMLQWSVLSLTESAAEQPLVLGVDDAHLLDPSSATLVLELTRRRQTFVILTVRTGEQCQDAIAAVWRGGGVERVELGSLDEPQTEVLAEAIAGGPIEQAARHWIRDTSLGNALYVRELVLGAIAGGALSETYGLWRMASRPTVNASLVELVTARMAGLPAACVDLLELLAIGEPLCARELVALTGEQALIDLEAAGLTAVGEHRETEVRLSHPLYGEAIRASLPALRSRQRQLQLVEAMQRRDELHGRDLLRVTHWLLDAGRDVAPETLLLAAETAIASGDPGLAGRLAEASRAIDDSIEALLLLGRARVLEHRYAEADQLLRFAEPQLVGPHHAIAWLDQRTTVLYWGLRRHDELRELLTRARDWWPDAEWQKRVDAIGLLSVSRTTGPHALETSARLHGDDVADPELQRRVAPIHAFNLFLAGRVADAYDLAVRNRAGAPLRDISDQLRFGLWSRISLESGIDWQELDRWNSAALQDGLRLSDDSATGRAALVLANLRFAEGNYKQAGVLLSEAELHLQRRPSAGLMTLVHSLRVGIACMTGDAELAESALADCESSYGGETPSPSELPYVARARGSARRARGELTGARACLLDAARELDDTPVYAARLTYEALRAGANARELTPGLQRLAQRCNAPLPSAYAAHATALAARDANCLMLVSEEMLSIGARRYAAEAAADAATAFFSAGRQDSGRRAVARSRELCVPSEGGIAPVIAGVEVDELDLTARERELVGLASQGLSNAQIAERLVVSVRTVESHLYRAMRKLGVSSRRELASRAHDVARLTR